MTDLYLDQSISFAGGEYKDGAFHYRLMRPEVVETGKTYPLIISFMEPGNEEPTTELQLLYFPAQMAEKKWRKISVLLAHNAVGSEVDEVDWESERSCDAG
ncbi:MAG: hypothetical protein U0996_08360 [Planctomycetaceae bacterium]